MPETRRSARLASAGSNYDSDKASIGDKRTADAGSSPFAKHGKKKQTKIDKMATNGDVDSKVDDKPMQDAPSGEANDTREELPAKEENGVAPAEDKAKPKAADSQKNEEGKSEPKESAVEPSKREGAVPSSILEKGIIYFFFRPRVNVEEPENVDEIRRSYIILRPLPHGAKLSEGPIGDAGNSRLIALPKKTLPTSHRDRFISFTEKAHINFWELKENFIAGFDYETKTSGTRHNFPAIPVGEGVYAITTTGRESHLAYILTNPSELSEVQKDIGLRERGSFIASTRNPQYEAPANVGLPKAPEFPKEIIDEFRHLRWIGLRPRHLDYPNAQILLIGEGAGEFRNATEQQAEDAKKEKETPTEELEKLEREDRVRAEHLKGDDPVFEDLGLSAKDYPKTQTTW